MVRTQRSSASVLVCIPPYVAADLLAVHPAKGSSQRVGQERAGQPPDSPAMTSIADALKSAFSVGDDTPEQAPIISDETLLDDLFTYHAWSPEQVAKGNAIRAAAKELSRITIAQELASRAFLAAIKASAPDETQPAATGDVQTKLRALAALRRKKAIKEAERHVKADFPQYCIEHFAEIVMLANSAITFEAANPEATA